MDSFEELEAIRRIKEVVPIEMRVQVESLERVAEARAAAACQKLMKAIFEGPRERKPKRRSRSAATR
jgi:hypothetical protein